MIGHADLAPEVAFLGALTAATGAYVLAWAARPTPFSRLVWWALGVAVLVVADSPPVHAMAERSFTGHMLQHLLILAAAAPALVLARPGRTFARLVSARMIARARGAGRAARPALVVAGPVVANVILVVIHVTSIYERALRSEAWHVAEHAGFLVAGFLLWSAVLAPLVVRGPWRVATAFATVAATSLLGMVIATSRTPLSSTYVERQGLDAALDDQRLGASLMWVGGMALTVPLVVAAVWRWAAAEERATQRRERLAAEHGVGAGG
jgi:putative membrane protein